MKKNKAQDKSVPWNLDAERMILAAIVLNQRVPNGCLLQSLTRMKAEDFGLDSHQRIFRAMERLNRKEKPIEYVSLYEELQWSGEVEACGGAAYITDLVDATKWPRRQNVDYYIDSVLKASARMTIVHAAERAQNQAYDREEPGEIIGQLNQEISQLTERTQRHTCLPVASLADGVCQRIMQQYQEGRRFIGLPTPIGRLNFALGGLIKKELIVVAGDTGTGKTALALNITEHNCLKDNPVHWSSMEMDSDSLLLRLAAARTGINHMKVRNSGNMTQDELDVIITELAEIKRWPLWIDDTAGLTAHDMYTRGRMQAARGCKLIVSDYLQKLKAPGGNLREQINNASECTRSLAKDGNVPVLSLSQLARLEKTSKDSNLRKPTMHDLKESGNIEQDAHSVVLLWREQERDDRGRLQYTGNDAIIIGKNRNGPCFEIAVTYEKEIMVWRERDAEADGYDGKAAAVGS